MGGVQNDMNGRVLKCVHFILCLRIVHPIKIGKIDVKGNFDIKACGHIAHSPDLVAWLC